MVSTDITDRIFLGRGGARPGVMAVQDDISRSEWLAELAIGESVYAMVINGSGGKVHPTVYIPCRIEDTFHVVGN